MKKFLIFLFPLLLLFVWFFARHQPLRAFLSRSTESKAVQIPEKYILKAECRDVNDSIEVAGEVLPEFQLQVKSEVGGKIKSLHVKAGQAVKAGELLCEIDDTDLQNQKASILTEIEGAQLGIDRAQRHYDRGHELLKNKVITKEAIDNLESDLALARNEWSKSQRKLQTVADQITKARIVAPADGTVLELPVIEGMVVVPAASVNSGTLLMTLADLTRLLVKAHVNQIDVASLHPRQSVQLTIEAVKKEKLEGLVTFIAPLATLSNNIKGFDVEASILKPSKRLRPGMMVSLTIPVSHAEQVVAIPVFAVFKGENESSLVYVLEQGKPLAREVVLGVSGLDYSEIKKGLKVGEQILSVDPHAFDNKS